MADAFEKAILQLTSKIAPGDSISPAEAAREAVREIGGNWEKHIKAVRRAAVKLALEGRAVILLKGEMVDPEHFRGLYRIGGGDYFTPRKSAPAYTPPPPPIAPARDYKPEPRPYTPPPAPPAPAPQQRAAAPAPAPASARVTVRVSQPAAVRASTPPPPAPPPVALRPPPAPDPEPVQEPAFESSFEPVLEPVPHPRLAAPQDLSFEDDTDEAPLAAEAEWAADEGRPVTRFEFDPRGLDENGLDEEEPDFSGEARADEELEDDLPSPLPPLASSLSFDDEDYEDEDAGRAPQSATLDDIASQLERYLAAELNHPARGNAEIGDDIVRLPRQQDE